MSEATHVGTFLWGAILTIAGAALAAVGFGWWEISSFDLRYAGPMFVILVGAVILVAAFGRGRRSDRTSDPNN